MQVLPETETRPTPLSSAEFRQLVKSLKKDGAQGLAQFLMALHPQKDHTGHHSHTDCPSQSWLATAQYVVSGLGSQDPIRSLTEVAGSYKNRSLTSPVRGRGYSTHRVCLSVCLSVTILAGAAGT